MRSHRPFFDRSESKYTDISPNFDWKGNFGFPYGLVLRYTLTEFVECINKSGYSHLSMCVHLNGSTASVYLKIRYCFSICLQNSTAQGKKREKNERNQIGEIFDQPVFAQLFSVGISANEWNWYFSTDVFFWAIKWKKGDYQDGSQLNCYCWTA